MRRRPLEPFHSLFAAAALSAIAMVAVACGAEPPTVAAPPAEASAGATPATPPDPGAPVSSGPLPALSPDDPALARPRACKLPAPKKSGDPCVADADCGPSDPCHAPACVAKAKARPRTPDTACTMSLGCETADANRCGCYEGSCALIPPP